MKHPISLTCLLGVAILTPVLTGDKFHGNGSTGDVAHATPAVAIGAFADLWLPRPRRHPGEAASPLKAPAPLFIML
jgi:hypothetical protein